MVKMTDFFTSDASQADPMAVPPGTRAPLPKTGLPAQGEPLPSSSPVGHTPISEAEALKGGQGAKIDQIQVTNLQGGSGASGGAGNAVGLGSMVEGKLAIEAIDALLPALLVLGFRALKMTVKNSDLKLSAKEKDVLAPLVQKCLDSIMLNFNSPWTALTVTAVAIYGAKVVEHGGEAMLEKKEAVKEIGKTPVVPMAPKPALKDLTAQISADLKAAEAAKEAELAQRVPPYGEEQIRYCMDKKRMGRAGAIAWLEKFWVKKGGVI